MNQLPSFITRDAEQMLRSKPQRTSHRAEFFIALFYEHEGESHERIYDIAHEEDTARMKATLAWLYHQGIEARIKTLRFTKSALTR